MGTYTNYDIFIPDGQCEKYNYTVREIIAHLRNEYAEAKNALNEDGSTANEAKWYESDKDMKEFSKKYPEICFCLNQTIEGEGDYDEDEEEFEDLEWPTFYKNGQELSFEEMAAFFK